MDERDLSSGGVTRRELVLGAGAGAALLAAPSVALGGTRAAPASPLAERIAKNSKITVDTGDWKKSPPYTIALVTQGPFNGWGKMYNVAAQYAAAASKKVKK